MQKIADKISDLMGKCLEKNIAPRAIILPKHIRKELEKEIKTGAELNEFDGPLTRVMGLVVLDSAEQVLDFEDWMCGCNCLCNFSNEHRHFSQRKCEHCDGKGNHL